MTQSIKTLELALRVWEDVCFSQNIAWKYAKEGGNPYHWNLEGAFLHWNEYRDHILNLSPLDSSSYDAGRFSMPEEPSRFYPILKNFPEALANWTTSSRRVYSLSRELAALLTATSLRDLTWRDVSFPFNSFVITLEQPIADSKGFEYDCLLIAKGPVAGMSVLLFGTDFKLYQPHTDKLKERWRALLRKKRFDELYNQFSKSKFLPSSSILGVNVNSLDEPVIDSLRRMFRNTKTVIVRGDIIDNKVKSMEGPFGEVMTHIVVGFCLYLTTLPYGSTYKSDWQAGITPDERRRNPKAIMNRADICSVGSNIRLTTEQIKLIESLGTQANREVSSHFRQGHFRRPPGKGNDPEAKKTVHVSPAFVNRTNLVKGTLPVGAKTTIA